MKLSEITTESGDLYMMAVYGGDEFLDDSLPLLPFNLILTNCKAWYEGVVTRDDIDRAVTSLKMDRSSYYQYLREAFFNLTDTSKCIFDIEKMDLVKKVKFVWKRIVEPGNIKYQLGSVKLREGDSEDVVKRLLLTVMSQLDKNTTKIAQLGNERDRLAADRDETLTTLTKCVDVKQTMEKDLFGKFLAILNEKKTFIRSLENEDTAKISSRHVQSPSSACVASTSGTSKQTVASRADADLLFDDFGDDDDEPIRRKPKAAKTKEKRKLDSMNNNNNNNTSKSKTAVKDPSPPKITRRSTRGDSDPSKLLDML